MSGDPEPARSTSGWRSSPSPNSRAAHKSTSPLSLSAAATHVRFNIYPDGGVARLRVMGDPIPPTGLLNGSTVDLAALANGGRAVDCSTATTITEPHARGRSSTGDVGRVETRVDAVPATIGP